MPAPANCLAPDATVDAHGLLHLVYGLDRHAFYFRPTGEVGVAGQSSSGTKATAFVGSDDNFCVLTAAR